MRQERIVVTGINGFVGEHLARHLKESGYSVTGVAREDQPNQIVEPLLDSYEKADLLDKQAVSNLSLGSARAIIHLAGLASIADSFKHADLYKTANAEMTDNLLSESKSQGFNGRVVAISSGALYDPAQPLPLSENSKTTDNSPYAIGKLRAEEVIKLHINSGVDAVIARPFNHIGPGQGHGFLVPDLYGEIVNAKQNSGNTISVGNLNTRRDYTDVRDIVRAYTSLATAERLNHKIYNIASGVSHSGMEIFKYIAEAAGVPDITPMVDPEKIRPTDIMDITGDSTLIRNELGWRPELDIRQAIIDFVERKASASVDTLVG